MKIFSARRMALAIGSFSGCASIPAQSYNRVGDHHEYLSKCADAYYAATHACNAYLGGE